MKKPIRYVHIAHQGDEFYDADGKDISAAEIVEEINRLERELAIAISAMHDAIAQVDAEVERLHHVLQRAEERNQTLEVENENMSAANPHPWRAALEGTIEKMGEHIERLEHELAVTKGETHVR
jgi:predicted  nucleic acid-binding Zn-ribbon protein